MNIVLHTAISDETKIKNEALQYSQTVNIFTASYHQVGAEFMLKMPNFMNYYKTF